MMNFQVNKYNKSIWVGGVFLLSLALYACGDSNENAAPVESDTPVLSQEVIDEKPTEAPAASVKPEQTKAVKLEASVDIPADDPAIVDLPTVKISTSKGDISLVLYPDQAPLSVENFLTYVEGRQYTRTIFHRVIPEFMIQGGGFSVYLEQRRTRDPVTYEGDNGLKNERGTLAMARTNDPNSATAQWYINHVDNFNLDHGARGADQPGYTVFGRVISGMNIVDEIAYVETSTQLSGTGQELRNVPVEPVIIETVEIIKK